MPQPGAGAGGGEPERPSQPPLSFCEQGLFCLSIRKAAPDFPATHWLPGDKEMNGTRRAELEEAEGCPGFMALTHPSLFMGVPRYPRLWDEGSQACIGGFGAHPGQISLCSVLGSPISLR